MNKKNFQEIPFHSFLVGFYFLVFVFAQNSEKLVISMTFRSVLVSLALSVILFLAFKLILRNNIKTGIYTTLVLFGIFSYGFFYNNCEDLYYFGKWPFPNIHRYLVIIYAVVFLFLLIIIYLTKRKLIFINHFLNYLVLIVIGINLVRIIYFELQSKPFNAQIHENPFLKTTEIPSGTPSADAFPDIYYIVLDGYANQHVLKKYFDFDNTPFITFLTNHGFYVANESSTNYPSTRTSLSSSLNMNYINTGTAAHTPPHFQNLISQNLVAYFLKQKGYKIVFLPSGYAVTNNFEFADEQLSSWGPNEFERSILRLTVFRLDDLTGIMTFLRLNYQLKEIKKIPAIPSPKFCFIHIVCPHPPFVFNKNGGLKLKSISDKNWETRSDYVNQLEYVNKSIEDYLRYVINRTDSVKPVIILQSDHGPWIKDSIPENIHEARTKILNAFYAPDEIKNKLYTTITPVNSFRIVFNEIFKTKFPLLDDIPLDKNDLIGNPVFQNYLSSKPKSVISK